ncbi:MAG: hypothetical protein ACJ72N_15985 [Labedaea sp.]
MGKIARLTGGAMAAAALILLAPLTASAGGPTSVLLVSPGRQATASLYTTDEAYGRLLSLLGEDPVADQGAPNLTGGPGSDAINVTWLVHDVQIWRVDRIFTDAAGGPWIQTIMAQDGNPELDATGIVHRAVAGKELIALLSAMRLLGSSPVPAFQGPKADVAAAAGASPAGSVTQAEPKAAEPKPAELNWLWLIVGAAAGATLVIGFRPVVRRLRAN